MAYNCDVFNDGSNIAFYEFEGNANDICGNYNGTWYGNEQYDKGIIGQAAKFDGQSYIYLFDHATTKTLLGNGYSLSFWFKPLLLNSDQVQVLFDISYGGGGSSTESSGGYIYITTDNKLNFGFKKQSNTTDTEITFEYDKILEEKFYFVTINAQNSLFEVYINNEKVFSETNYELVFEDYDNSDFVIGAYKYADGNSTGSPSAFYTGLIDHVRIFNRVLTDEEIKILYNEPFSLKNIQVFENKNTIQVCDIFNDKSCVATYTFDNQNANDICGNYNGTWYGNEQYDKGKFGFAAKFDGQSYINLGNENLIVSSNFTISLWIYLDESNNDDNILIQKQRGTTGGNYYAWAVRLVDSNQDGRYNDLGFAINDEYYLETNNQPLKFNEWNHIVAKQDNSGKYLYVNNVLVAKDNEGNILPTQTTNYPTKIAAWSDSNYLFTGLIDHVRIFNRDLTEEEINLLYNEQVTFKFNTDKYKKVISFNPRSVNFNKADFFKDNSGILNLPLEKDSNDLLNKYNGIWQGTEQYQNNIFFGNAYFDGNSWIELPDRLENLFIKNNNFTITGWFKYHSFENWSRIFDFKDVIIFCNKSTDPTLYCAFKYEAIENNDYSKGKYIEIPGATTNLWYFYAITWDGNDLNIVLKTLDDRSLSITKGEYTTGSAPKDSVIKNYLGHSNWSSNGDALFKGEQARFKVFNRVLTEEEIDYLFNEGGYLISSESYLTESKRENLIIGLDFTRRQMFYEVPGLYRKYLIDQSRFDIPVLEDKEYTLEIEHQLTSSIVNIKENNSIIYNQELKHGVLASIIEDTQEYAISSGINITNPGAASDLLIYKNEIALFTGEAKNDILGLVSFDNSIEILENNYDLKSKFEISLENGQFVKKFSPFRHTMFIQNHTKGININISNIEENEEIYMIIPCTNYTSSNEMYLDGNIKIGLPYQGTMFVIMKITNDGGSITNRCMYSTFDDNIDVDKRNLTIKDTGWNVSTNMYLYPLGDMFTHGIYFTKEPLKILSSIWSNIQLPIVDSYYYSINSKLEAIYY